MTTDKHTDKPTYEQFRDEWLDEIENAGLSPFEKGLQFATKLVTQWLGVTSDDDDFVICDGSGDGGIDIAYLERADDNEDVKNNEAVEGDTWYLIQSKYGTAFAGSDTILQEGNKVITTLLGETSNLSEVAQQLLDKLETFRQQASEADRLVLVFATTNPIAQQDRDTLERIKIIGREQIMSGFDVEEVSLMTIWEALDDVEPSRLTVPVSGQFVEQSSGLLVGTVPLIELFNFLRSYQSITGNLDQIYEKNVRQFLGNRRKINKGIANTLSTNPEKFGLYNNGITIVVSNYSRSSNDGIVTMNDPYIVNGCQTTRTIWQVLDSKLNAGGTGQNKATEDWKTSVERGGVVTKIVRSDEAEITNITRFTNSQNSVREQDFIALHSGFRAWANAMREDYNIFMEIQRGGTVAMKAWQKQHPDESTFDDYVNAFDLVKVYGAGWLGHPGSAFGKNPPFLPNGSIYKEMVDTTDGNWKFSARDLYAAYIIKCAADDIGFGRTALPSRRLTRFLFYHVVMRMLHHVIRLTPGLNEPLETRSVLTEAVHKLAKPKFESQFKMLCDAAIALIDQYMTPDPDPHSGAVTIHREVMFLGEHAGNMNHFLKSPSLGKEDYSPLLLQLINQTNQSMASIRLLTQDGSMGPTQREFIALALIAESDVS